MINDSPVAGLADEAVLSCFFSSSGAGFTAATAATGAATFAGSGVAFTS
jgi:hypothetical protein